MTHKMKPHSSYNLLLFGDQTDNVGATIRHLYAASSRKQPRSGDSGLLAKFLRDATDVCQIAFGNLQPRFRDDETAATADFESLLELSEKHDETDGSPVLVSCTLSYFARLGELILRAECDPAILTSPRVVIGLCVCIFPAALAATARSATELAKLAVEAFPSYFNMALANHIRAKNIEWQHGTWSYMFPSQSEFTMQPYLDGFHKKHSLPNHKKAWIGIIGYNWVTVSGPPSVLERMLGTPAFQDLPHMALPVAGAVHAPHLAAPDFESVVEPSLPLWALPLRSEAFLMSTHKCVPYEARILGEVARQIFTSVMQEPLLLQNTFSEAAKQLKKNTAQVTLSVVGPSAQTGRLIRTLRDIGVRVTESPVPDLKLDVSPQPALRGGSGAVAIVGMSARFPGAEELEPFWKLLMKGGTTHRAIPQERFNFVEFYDRTGATKNSISNIDGCFLDNPGDFDTKLFQMSPREAMLVDPTHRLLLMVSLEALERAGYSYSVSDSNTPTSPINNRTAVYFGQNSDVWREVNAQQGIDVYTAPGLLRAFSPGRVNRHFGFDGGSYSVDTACSSSATATQLACTALLNRECDMALAGGAQIAYSPFEFAALGQSGFLAPSGGCKTFRADANGYCRGEAVGVLVLKRLEDALANNDNVVALVTGWGRNYSAASDYITAPHPESQEKLVRKVLRQANAKPEDVGYVELHGTGTKIGDAAEMKMVTRVFGEDWGRHHSIHVGSVKANIGHSESAAGVSSVIKAALMLEKGTIPPQATIKPDTELHPEFKNLKMDRIRIDTRAESFDSKKKSILVNSLDAAGGNTCLLVERAPQVSCDEPRQPSLRNWHIVTISAATAVSRENYKKKFLEYLKKNRDISLADIAYSTTARRTHYQWRSHYVVRSKDQLEQELRDSIRRPTGSRHHEHDIPNRETNGQQPDIVFVFSGQGSQNFGVAKVLYETHPAFQQHLDVLDKICRDIYPEMTSVAEVILSPNGELDPSNVVESHVTLVCIQLALAELWKSWSVKPAMVLGHSIGEYAALCVAGVLSISDTLYLVVRRACLIKRISQLEEREYGMVSFTATREVVQHLLSSDMRFKECSIGCYNGPHSHVVGGPQADLEILVAEATRKRITARVLKATHAYHTTHVEFIGRRLSLLAEGVSFLSPKVKVASAVTGSVVSEDGVFNASYIARHTCQPIRFRDVLEIIQSEYPLVSRPLWLELGLGHNCLALIKMTLNTPTDQLLACFQNPQSSWETVTESVGKLYQAGCRIDWSEFHRPFESKVKLLELPTYQFDLATYWQPYTKDTAEATGINMGVDSGSQGRAGEVDFVPTATVQKILYQSIAVDTIEVIFISSPADPALRDAIRGHRIGDFSVCPASVYVDMALTAATYVNNRYLLREENLKVPLREVRNMKLDEPFVLAGDPEKQEIAIIVKADNDKNNDRLKVMFKSSRIQGGRLEHLGECDVVGIKHRVESAFSLETTKQNQNDMENGMRGRAAVIDIITEEMNTNNRGHIERLGNVQFYQIFSDAISYDARYRSVKDAYIPEKPAEDGSDEAVAKVALVAPPAKEAHAFARLNPYHGDSLVHLGGFLANMNIRREEDALYFSFRIDRIKIFAEVIPNNNYLSYVRLSTDEKGNRIVHAQVWNGSYLVGIAALRFSRIKKSALMKLLAETRDRFNSTSATEAPSSFLPPGFHPATHNPTPAPSAESMADIFISAIVSETGINCEDVQDTTRLSELGIDSLMGIAILRKVKAETNQTIPMSVFQELQMIRDVRERFGPENFDVHEANEDDRGRNAQGEGNIIVPTNDSYQNPWIRSPLDKNLTTIPAHLTSNAVLLHQGLNTSSSRGVRPLFFLAGSSGSAAVYGQLPALKANIDTTPIWVLESPFLNHPAAMIYTPEEIAPLYIAAMRKVQSNGPYLLGGYSAGAIHAYEMARLLLEEDEQQVEKLVIVDMKAHLPGESFDREPKMRDVHNLNIILRNRGLVKYDGTISAGASGASSDASGGAGPVIPERERQFASLKCVYNWRPTPMAANHRPAKGTLIIWARWGLSQRLSAVGLPELRNRNRDVNPMAAENGDYKLWFHGARHDGTYGANGWDVLVGPNVETHVVDGNHWSILNMPYAEKLAELIDQAITSCSQK